MDTNNTVEATVTSVASRGMGGGAATSMVGWLASNEAIALIGVIITVLGFVVNLIFQIRRDRRDQELQRVKLLAILNRQESED